MKRIIITATISLILFTDASAKIYMWVGGVQKKDLFWKNPGSWSPPDDDSYPCTTEDTVQFNALARSHCVLNADVEINSLHCMPGFVKTLHLSTKKLSISGDADFSHGNIIASKGTCVFTGGRDSRQIFTPKGGILFAAVEKNGESIVEVTGPPLKAGTISIDSGTWQWGPGLHTILRGISVRGKATMVFQNDVTLNIASGNAYFGGLAVIQSGERDTLCFSGVADTQIFTPKNNVVFPHIKKVNKGAVVLSTNPLSAGALVVKAGTWDWGNVVKLDTVRLIQADGGSGTMIFDNKTIVILDGDVDLSGLETINANSGTIDFAGSQTQYFTSKLGLPSPKISHSGTGLLFRRTKRGNLAIVTLEKSHSALPVFPTPEKAILREQITSFELGMNTYGQAFTSRSNKDTVSLKGTILGLLIPVKVPYVVLWFHVKGLFHGTTSADTAPKKVYWSASNELLVGKPFLIKYLPFEYTPLLGFGILNGVLLYRQGSEFVIPESRPYLFANIGLMIRNRISLKKQTLMQGVLFTSEHHFIGHLDSRMRIGVTFVGGY